MPDIAPLASSGKTEPAKRRPAPIRKDVKAAIALMVLGREDDPDCKPLTMIEAAKGANMAPDILRRWLDRPNVRAHLLDRRRAFRTAICAGNELSLLDVRDNALNSMARIAAVRTLEQLHTDDPARKPGSGQQTPGITIIIRNEAPAPPAAAGQIVNITPQPAAPDRGLTPVPHFSDDL